MISHVPYDVHSSRISEPLWIFALSRINTLLGPGKGVVSGSYGATNTQQCTDIQQTSERTTCSRRKSRKSLLVTDPSTTVAAIIPSAVSAGKSEYRVPRMNTSVVRACSPRMARPNRRPTVFSSLWVSSVATTCLECIDPCEGRNLSGCRGFVRMLSWTAVLSIDQHVQALDEWW